MWKTIVDTGISRIQAHNADILIIVSSPNWNTIDSDFVSFPFTGNIIYSWDYYYKDYGSQIQGATGAYETGNYVTGRTLMEAKMHSQRLEYANQIPIICSEFGFASWHYSDGNMVEQSVWDYIDIINQTGTGWLDWMVWDSGNYGLWNSNFASLRFPTGTVMKELLPPAGSVPPAPDPTPVPIPLAMYNYRRNRWW